MTEQIKLVITNPEGQETVFVPQADSKFPDHWQLALDFTAEASRELGMRGLSGWPEAAAKLLIHLTGRPY